jgi:hypothetical protein
VVWAIRRFRPDVIVTRFSPEMRDTHGHHVASAMLAVEAFHAAADPKAYPEQLRYVQPWQARRIVWNKGVWPGAPKEDLSGFLALDVGSYDPLLGVSYGELAAKSRSMHKTQGFGVSPSRGPALEYFKLLAGEPMQKSFLDGIDTSWRRVKGGEKTAAALEKARAAFRPARPWEAIPALLEALAALPGGNDEKRRAMVSLIAGCAGLHVEAVADEFTAVTGGERKITASIVNRSPLAITLRQLRIGKQTLTVQKPLPTGQPLEIPANVTIDAPPSNPYWLVDEPAAGRWTVKDQELVGLPEAPPAVAAELELEIGGHRFTLSRAVDYAWNDPVAGERRRPLEILPPFTVEPLQRVLLYSDDKPKELHVKVTATAPVEGELQGKPFKLAKKGDEAILSFSLPPQTKTINFGTGVKRLEYPHLPITTLTPAAQVKLVRLDLKRGGARIGYLPGPGDEVAAALRQAGYDVTLLSEEKLAKEPLKYDAIITGVRAYNVHPWLTQLNSRLLEYVHSGGTLLVQYNTQNRISKLAGDIGPYPFHISQDRVTDESAAVELADDPILNTPNKIGAADFAGWVQERGLYFADKWDDHYRTLLTMNDPGESPKKGAILVSQYGKGRFVYTGIAFFRQLPAGVSGAFRLFANLIAHGK